MAGAGSSTAYGNEISIGAALSGTGSFSFLGSGTWNGSTGNNGGILRLSGNNTYSGGTTVGLTNGTVISNGILSLESATAMGTGAITVNRFSQLLLNATSGTSYSTTATLTLRGSGSGTPTYGTGALTMPSGNNYTWGGPVTIDSGAVIAAHGTSTLTLTGTLTQNSNASFSSIILLDAGTATAPGSAFVTTGVIAGAGNDTLLGNGTWNGASGVNGGIWKMGGATNNSFSGTITVGRPDGTSNGILEMDDTTAFISGGTVVINKNSQLYLNAPSGRTFKPTGTLRLRGGGSNWATTGIGALYGNSGSSYKWLGPISTDSNAVIRWPGAGTLTFSAVAMATTTSFVTDSGSSTGIGGTIVISGTQSGSGTDSLLGGGTWDATAGTGKNGGLFKFGAVNLFTGPTVVGRADGSSSGILELDVINGIANSTANKIYINKNSQLFLAAPAGTYALTSDSLFLNGNGNNYAATGLGALVSTAGNAYTWQAPIKMLNNASISVLGNSSASSLTLVNVNLAAPSTFVCGGGASSSAAGATLSIGGVLSGSSADTFYGGGTWNGTTGSGNCGGLLKLGAANTFTGGLIAGKSDGSKSGVVELDNLGSITSATGNNITINSNSQLYLAAANGSYTTSLDTLYLSGLGTNYSAAGTGALTTKSNSAYTWPGPIRIVNKGSISAQGTSSTGSLTISGNIYQNSAATFIAGAGISATAQGSTLNITGVIDGAYADTFYGNGTWNASAATGLCGGLLKLGGANTFTGGFVVGKSDGTSNGILQLDNLAALNNITGNFITVNPNSQLSLTASTGTYNVTNTVLNLNGAGNNLGGSAIGAFTSKVSTAYTWSGRVNLASAATITPQASSTLTLTGNVTGSGTLTKSGTGILVLSGTGNTYSGGTVITAGNLNVSGGSTLSTDSLTFYQAGTSSPTVQLNNAAQTISQLQSFWSATTGTINQILNLPSASTVLTINQNTNTTFGDGALTTLKSVITGSGAIVKAGTGTLTLTSTGHNFTGGCTISNGQLRFNPSANLTLNTPITFNGGTMSTNGITGAGVTLTFGTLNIADNSIIDLSTATSHFIKFSASSAISFTPSKILLITNWQGDFSTGSSTVGKIYVGTTSSGLSSAQLAQIRFKDASGNLYSAKITSTGEIVPMLGTISTSASTFGPFCSVSTNPISVSFSTNGLFSGNFKVQLSDSTGSFAGMDTSTNIIGVGSGTAAPITATIPASTSGIYRVRVINGLPFPVYGTDNGNNIILEPSAPVFGTISASNVLYANTTTLTCTPSGGTWSSSNSAIASIVSATGLVTGATRGTCTITYTATNTCSTAYTTTVFSVVDLPTITSITPSFAKVGDTVTIAGQYFNSSSSSNKVYFGATAGTVFNGTSTSLSVIVNSGATLGPVSVLNTGLNLTGASARYFNPVFQNSIFADTINLKSRVDFSTDATTYLAAIGDLDRDGKSDLVAANYNATGTISVFRNVCSGRTITSGSLSFISNLSSGSYSSNVRLVDIDGDGLLDIVSCSKGTSRVYVFRNTTTTIGSITFASPVFFSTGSTYGNSPYALTVADIDMDGRPDIAVTGLAAGYECFVVLRNTSTTGVPITSGSFASPVAFTTGQYPASIAAGDFDGDGRPDIAVACSTATGTIHIFRNTATSGTINSGSFAASVDYSGGSVPADLQPADFDGDGKLDLVESNFFGNSISIFRNNGSSGTIGFASRVDFSTGSYPGGVGVGDFNGDNKIDIVVDCAGSNKLYLYRNTATSGSISASSLANPQQYNTGTAPAGVKIGDIDGDGYPDIVAANSGDGTISIFEDYPLPIVAPITGTFSVCMGGGTTTLYDSTSGGVWSMSNSNATINPTTGFVTGYTAGLDTALYRIVAGGDTNYARQAITINALPAIGPINGYSVVCPGVYDTLTNDSTSGTATWSLSNTTRATISASGVLYAIAEGVDTAYYHFTSAATGCSNTQYKEITIAHTSVAGTITGTNSLCAGATTSLADTGGDAGGTWSTANVSLATVSSTGVVYGLAAGTVQISYTISGCGTAFDTIFVTVLPLPAPGVISGAPSVCTSATISLTDTASSGTWSSSNTSIATVSATGVVTGLATGSATISYSVTNTCGTASATYPFTVNSLPTTPPAITGAATVCSGNNTTLANTTTGGRWSSSNNSIVTIDSLTGIAYGVSIGSATITYAVSNACGASITTTSETVLAAPTAFIVSAAQPCTGHTTNIVFNGTASSTVGYQIDGGGVLYGTLTAGTYTLVTTPITASHTYTLHNVDNGACISNIDTTATIAPLNMQWVGENTGHETDWNTAANWSCGTVPTGTDDVTIPVTTYAPAIGAAGGSVRDVVISSGVTITVGSGASMIVKGNLTNNGAVSGAGTLTMNNSAAQSVSGIGDVSNFNVNNTSGVTLASGARLTILKTLSLSAGSLATNDSVVLYSDSTGSARVATMPSGTAITGKVKVNQYFAGGRRAYRFWSHPFNAYIPLSQITPYIDISGPGGATNGFTTTATNAPSSYRYSPIGGNSSMLYDPGWRQFASAYGTPDSNRFKQYQGIRIYSRGAKGEGFGFGSYTPSSAVVSQVGVLNQGNQDVPMLKGTSTLQDYNMVGNPYASPVDIGTVVHNAAAAGRINGAAFYIWNPFLGVAGQFQAINYNDAFGAAAPYYLQANSAFQVRAAHDGDQLNFTEAHKSATITSPYSLMKARKDMVTLFIYDNNYHPYDVLNLRFDGRATDNEDAQFDAGKPSGADLNFYSLSADGSKLAIDVRPFNASGTIPLGITSNFAQRLLIKVENLPELQSADLYLHDKLLNTLTLLHQGTEYGFDITEQPNTQGNHRFELIAKPTSSPAVATANDLQISVLPNPATDEVHISITSGVAATTSVNISSLSGAGVYTATLEQKYVGEIVVPIAKLAPGIYLVEVTAGTKTMVRKLVKE